MSSPTLESVIECPTLPSLPAVALEVLSLMRDPNVPIKEIAEVVQNDQALAGKILKTVNSSYYGLASPCPTISRAMGYLGLNTVKSLVLGFSLVDTFSGISDGDGFDLTAYWRRGIYGAAGARLLARTTRAYDPDEAFIAALLQDVGMLAMITVMEGEYEAVLIGCPDHETVVAGERDIFGFDHCETGAALAAKWRLPENLIEAIRCHHNVEKAPPDHLQLLKIITLGNTAARTLSDADARKALAQFRKHGVGWFAMDAKSLNQALEDVATGAKEISRLFDLDTGGGANVKTILGEAGEALIEHQVTIERERESLSEVNSELSKQALTDGLTGASNRKCFDELSAEAFEKAKNGGSMGVLFSDADKFKLVNDTHGHLAGDAILVELARRMRTSVSDRGTVCRYGGEEFAIILPGLDRAGAAAIAEEIRVAIASKPFDIRHVEDSPDELPITVSLGVAVIEPDTADLFANAEALVQCADKAVYAAKKSGRNCVRVFNAKKAASASTPKEAPAQPEPSETQAPPEPEGTALPLGVNTDRRASRSSSAPADGEQKITNRIMLVEDDSLHAKLIEMAAHNIGGIELKVATGVKGATEMLGLGTGDGYRPNLVLCDLGLPDGSGLDLVQAIRKDSRLQTLPIVVLSANTDDDIVERCLRAGANAFFSKSKLCEDPFQRLLQITDFWACSARSA